MSKEIFFLPHNSKKLLIRRALDSDVPALRILLNSAYKELSDKGWNFTASYQDDQETLQHIQSRRVFVVFEEKELIGTVSLRDENWFTNLHTMYIGKLAVHTKLKKSGIGTSLMKFAEEIASYDGYHGIQLDTAKPAEHLVKWYQNLGYKIIGDTQFEGKTYESWIFEKKTST
ncbi:MAG: GNAT family N-acetyltransferase [Bdellovibrionota bacterium]